MPQQLLDHPQIGAAFEHVGGVGVTQRVRMHVVPGPGCRTIFAHQALDAAAGEALAVPVQEQRVGLFAGRSLLVQVRAHLVEVTHQRFLGGLSVQRFPLLIPLTADQDRALAEVDVRNVHAVNLGQPHATGVQQLQDGLVPKTHGRRLIGGIQQAFGLAMAQERGQRLGHLEAKTAARGHGSGLEHAFLDQEEVEGTKHCQFSSDTDPFVALAIFPHWCGQPRQVAPQGVAVHVPEVQLIEPEVLAESLQISQVHPLGVLGQAALTAQVGREPFHERIKFGYVGRNISLNGRILDRTSRQR